MLTERLHFGVETHTVKYDMREGKVAVRTVPSLVHGSAVGIFNYTVISWADNPAQQGPRGAAIKSFADASMPHTLYRSDSQTIIFRIEVPSRLMPALCRKQY
jgi:hypothetical protein